MDICNQKRPDFFLGQVSDILSVLQSIIHHSPHIIFCLWRISVRIRRIKIPGRKSFSLHKLRNPNVFSSIHSYIPPTSFLLHLLESKNDIYAISRYIHRRIYPYNVLEVAHSQQKHKSHLRVPTEWTCLQQLQTDGLQLLHAFVSRNHAYYFEEQHKPNVYILHQHPCHPLSLQVPEFRLYQGEQGHTPQHLWGSHPNLYANHSFS